MWATYHEPYGEVTQTEKKLYSDMYNSVTNPNNKGFYIGRYRARKDNNKAVVKKNMPVWDNVKWSSGKGYDVLTGGAVQYSREFTNDKLYKGKITSNLIYGIQWDAALRFFSNGKYFETGSCTNFKNVVEIGSSGWEWTWEYCEGYNYPHRIVRNGISERYHSLEQTDYATRGSFRLTLYF